MFVRRHLECRIFIELAKAVVIQVNLKRSLIGVIVFFQMEDARPVPQFRCEEIEKNRLYNEWKIWKRALECYFDAYDIKDQKKMRAKLLHLGGPQLQRVFENLPDRENFPVVSVEMSVGISICWSKYVTLSC